MNPTVGLEASGVFQPPNPLALQLWQTTPLGQDFFLSPTRG